MEVILECIRQMMVKSKVQGLRVICDRALTHNIILLKRIKCLEERMTFFENQRLRTTPECSNILENSKEKVKIESCVQIVPEIQTHRNYSMEKHESSTKPIVNNKQAIKGK